MKSTSAPRFAGTLIAQLLLLSACAAVCAQSFSQVLSFQGRLCGTDGSPLADGEYSVQFTIYDAETNGTALWSETQTVVQIGGVFSAKLGSVTAFPGDLFADGDRWLGIKVGDDPEIGQRVQFTPSPWSIFSANAGADDDWTFSGNDIYRLDGNVGIGTSSPSEKLHVAGPAANLRLQDDDDPRSYLAISDAGPGQAWINKYAAAGSVLLDLAPIPMDGVSDASIRFFRGTNTTGLKQVRFHSGNGTTAVSAVIGMGGADSVFQLDGGSFGIGTLAPTSKLDVQETDPSVFAAINGYHANGAGTKYGVYGRSDSTSGRGVSGYASAATGTTYGVLGTSGSTSGRGVMGTASASSGTTYGVLGWSASNDGTGVFGEATATTGYNYGVYGRSDSPTGSGVYGENAAATGVAWGGHFESAGTSGYAVYGAATNHDGTHSCGGHFQSAGTQGVGVFGQAYNGDGDASYGVWGSSAGTAGVGVFGHASAATGAYGVWGRCENYSTGYGVFSWGRFGASGTKSFRIDHPDDPEHKYLLHYSTESPEVLNAYSGTITLDGAGEATVELPHYFAKINKDPRYTLTPIGAPMPMLHISEKISAEALASGAQMGPGDAAPICTFRIGGGVAGGEVSWEVKAVRNDRWVRQRGAPVEVEKLGLERGTYQDPELYGQPPEMGMGYRPEPDPVWHSAN
jgi:hypothetical protein